MSYHVVVVGATGNVGREIISILAERNFPLHQLSAVASSQSYGREISFGEKKILKVQSLDNFDFTGTDIVFFAVDSELSKKYAPLAVKAGAIAIDKSSHFRLDPHVPLIVPEVNGDKMINECRKNIIASPNCIVVPLVVALNKLHQQFHIERIVLSTYQSVSGAGRRYMDELFRQTKGTFGTEVIQPVLFAKPIAFNLIPQIGEFCSHGMTEEEDKIITETQKIFGQNVHVFATCVRVPVFIGHSIAVNVEFKHDITIEQVKSILARSPSVRLIDRHESGGYVTPIDCAGEDAVFVSRVRKDQTRPSALGLWIVGDNLRKGAALNGVHIAETLIQHGMKKKIKKMKDSD